MKDYLPVFNINSHTTPKAASITFVWLLHLRWGAIFCQVVLIYMVGIFLQIEIPVPLVSAIISFEIVSNLIFFYLKKKQLDIKEWLFGAIMFIDVVLLTILLVRTGGAMNPFTFLYLLHVVIGAVLMQPVLAWILGIFTIICYSTLFFPSEHLGMISGIDHVNNETAVVCADSTVVMDSGKKMQLHLQGMLVAFAITTIFIVFFIGRIRKSLDNYYEKVEHLKAEMIKNEKLASLATLAAGAAHEFSTPLSTIAVAAGEMLHYCNKHEVEDELVDDVFLIKDQVAVCKEILDQLSSDSGTCQGEQFTQFTIMDLVEDIRDFFPDSKEQKLTTNSTVDLLELKAPYRTIFRTIKGLLNNASDATVSGDDIQIGLSFTTDDRYLITTIKDQGTGMNPETIRRATEPFFTTKAQGKGMGLGLFLARSVAESLGGGLDFESAVNQGTTVRLRMALAKIGLLNESP